MQRKSRYIIGVFIALFVFTNIANSEPTIVIPVRFHIITELSMKKNNVEMRSWVTQGNIKDTILPEVNRIWQSANISFKLENILESLALNPPNQAELIEGIVNSHRDSQGKSDPERIKKLNSLISWHNHNMSAINIYLIPYLGETSQGNAKAKYKRIFVTQWSDKASRAKKPPKRFQLTENRPYKRGSLSRTIAHEIGHILRLKHPKKPKQTNFSLLMGGRKPGYNLTSYEIEIARKKAAKLFIK